MTPPVEDDRADDPMLAVDPFAALVDGRRQLVEALRTLDDLSRAAQTLASVIAHDEALREVATAYAAGERDFASIPSPVSRLAAPADPVEVMLERAIEVRASLLEAVFEATAPAEAMDAVFETGWGGEETWRMHLVVHAIHEGMHAHAIEAGDPPPPPISA